MTSYKVKLLKTVAINHHRKQETVSKSKRLSGTNIENCA